MSLSVKKDFPIFKSHKNLVYLDSAATSQKPRLVINAEKLWYEKYNANINRGAYQLAEQATQRFERARKKVADFIKAQPENIVFTKGTTESINLVAWAWAKHNLKKEDTILLTQMEHHANIVPWQLLASEKNLKLKYWPIDKTGELKKDDTIFKGVKLLAITQVSNVLGTINPLEKIIKAAHQKGIKILVDAAQSAPHLPINIKKLQPDFLVFSGHKMLGPTGIGVLYVDQKRYKEMKPYQGGGDMIVNVDWQKSQFKPGPYQFEAGTQPLAQVEGLAAAIDYLNKLNRKKVWQHNQNLVTYAYQKLKAMPEVIIYGPAKRAGLISFNVKGIHPHDLATWLDQYHIAIRAGHHCAQILHKVLNVPATARISFSVYNTKKDIDIFIKALKEILKKWRHSIKN